MKLNATAIEEEVQRLLDRYIYSVKSPDGCVLWSNREILEAFWAHIRDRFACCPDLPLLEFRCYLSDFPYLESAEAASCEGMITEFEIRDALKQVSLNQSPGLDGCPWG